jgi:hypothetical protein
LGVKAFMDKSVLAETLGETVIFSIDFILLSSILADFLGVLLGRSNIENGSPLNNIYQLVI